MMAAATPNDLADDLLAVHAERGPVEASLAGLPGYDDRLPDPTDAAEQAPASRAADIAERAHRLDPATLTAADRVTRAVVIHAAGSLADSTSACILEHTVSDSFTSPSHELLVSLPLVPVSDAGQAEGYLRRLGAVPRYLTAVADRHRAGLAAGRSPVAHLVAAAAGRLDRYLAEPDGDPLRRPGPATGTPGDFAGRRDRLLAEVVRPAVAGYRRMLASELASRSRPPQRPGLCWVPGGELAYAALVRVHTSTGRDPDDLHRTGLDLMAGLAGEYASLGARALGTADVTTVLDRLRNDPALRWTEPAEILAANLGAVHRAEAAAPGWFGRLPARRCEVHAVPSAEAQSMGSAYYRAASLDGTRPGIFFVNTSHPTRRPRHTAEAIAFTRRCRATTSSWRWRKDRPACRCCAGWPRSAPTPRAGRCTPSGSPTRWACTPATWRASAWSPRTPCGPAAWSSTPACTHAAGPASAPSATCATTPRWRTSRSSTRSTATSPNPHRRCPT